MLPRTVIGIRSYRMEKRVRLIVDTEIMSSHPLIKETH